MMLTTFAISQVEKSGLGVGHTGGIQFNIQYSGILLEYYYDLMLKYNYSYPAMSGCPINAGYRTLNCKFYKNFMTVYSL